MNFEILGALKSAMVRGDSIEQAMQSLINSGYSIQEIQEAANFIGTGEQPEVYLPEVYQPDPSIQPPSYNYSLPEKTPQKESSYEATYNRVTQKQTKQNVKESSKILIVTLIIILTLLLGTLIAFFIFKDQIISIFAG